ncbi:MAG: hypothetical protein JWQ29_204 [Phenylobacterium sp.]|nr:hypothetical protein [Phenylobacterium sp.]
MTKRTLRTLLLSGLALAGASLATSAMAALPLDQQFSLTESSDGHGGGHYTVSNNSASWYIFGFQVTNPTAIFAQAHTTQDNWYAYNCGSGCSNGGGDPYFSYFNQGGPFDFAHDLAPGVTSDLFTFNAPPASHYTLFLANSDSVTTTVSGDTGVPEPGVWSMMIMGFGLAGAALRRRRSASATI